MKKDSNPSKKCSKQPHHSKKLGDKNLLDEGTESISGAGLQTAFQTEESRLSPIESIGVAPPAEIVERTSLGFNTVLKIQKSVRTIFSTDFKTAAEAYEKRRTMQKCTTESHKLNNILGGGIETQTLTE